MILKLCSCPVFSSQHCVLLAVWGLALSCWNVISLSPSILNTSMNSSRCCCNNFWYTSWLIFSSTNTIGLSLLPAKQPQIICEIPLSRFFSCTFFGRYFSCLFWCLQTYTEQVSLSFLIVDSSDQMTLAQSSAVQYRCSLAHFIRFLACSCVNGARFTVLHFLTPTFLR